MTFAHADGSVSSRTPTVTNPGIPTIDLPDPEILVHRHEPPVLFIADVHLDSNQPEIGAAFMRFCNGPARAAGAVYILGDLFEVWVGDDDAPAWRHILDSLRGVTTAGVPVRLMPGNRDFLLGADFARATDVELLSDPVLVDLFGVPTLLTHGDILCTDDTDHQTFRRTVQSEAWQRQFLERPLEERRAIAGEMRAGSRDSIRGKSHAMMDVSEEAVVDTFRRYGVDRIIHGHTHRPACHVHHVDGRERERWVLGDWYEQASMLVAAENGVRPSPLDVTSTQQTED